MPGVDDGAVDVELVDDVGGLVPPAFGHRLLRVDLPYASIASPINSENKWTAVGRAEYESRSDSEGRA